MKNNKSLVLLFTILNTVIITLAGCEYLQNNISGNDHPNVIVIMTDDLGYVDVGFNGSIGHSHTQHRSRAHQGVRFTNGYTPYSVCSPSRAGFITGRYQQRFGYERNAQYRPNDPTWVYPK